MMRNSVSVYRLVCNLIGFDFMHFNEVYFDFDVWYRLCTRSLYDI